MTLRVVLPDVNVLIALVSEQHEHHAAAHAWFSTVGPWATTPITEAGLIRLILNPLVVGSSFDATFARSILTRLREQGDHQFLADDSSLTDPQIDLTALTGHRQVTDYHLVNLAAIHGCALATFDARLEASLAPADRVHIHVIPA